MKTEVMMIGKTAFSYLEQGCKEYFQRLQRFTDIEWTIIPDIKSATHLSPETLKSKEADAILAKLKPDDVLILLDENGDTFSSRKFARWIEQQQLNSTKKLVFLIGGAYGFDDKIYQRARYKISLSEMTFSHQLIRLIFMEQLYRAFTIINGLPYHHD